MSQFSSLKEQGCVIYILRLKVNPRLDDVIPAKAGI